MKKRESWIANKIDWEYRKNKRMKAKIEAKKKRETEEKKRD